MLLPAFKSLDKIHQLLIDWLRPLLLVEFHDGLIQEEQIPADIKQGGEQKKDRKHDANYEMLGKQKRSYRYVKIHKEAIEKIKQIDTKKDESCDDDHCEQFISDRIELA